MFGYKEFFQSTPRENTVKVCGITTMVSLSQEDFLEVMTDFPEDYEKYCMIKDTMMLYKRAYDDVCKSCS